MNRFYNLPTATKERILNETGEKTNLPAYAIEKDWWVVQTLTILFELEVGEHLVFKGGTSLSKAWNAIERFSEDIDLAIDRAFFDFNGELGKEQRTRLRKKANQYICGTLYPALQNAFNDKGIQNIRIELDEITTSDQDPVIISVYYPNVIESPGYIKPRVQIEIGCRSLREPFENRAILSLVDNTYPQAVFALQPINIPSVLPERTFLEKIFLLHEEFQRPKDKMRVDRLSRHLYDVYKMSKTEIVFKAFSNRELYETIVKHRYSFTRIGGINYNLHQPQTINVIPNQELMSSWAADYKTMQEQMIHGDSPNFDELIEALKSLNNWINNKRWRMGCEFPAPASQSSTSNS
jgi:predicted nucleotidyltransferase component of viral defense system